MTNLRWALLALMGSLLLFDAAPAQDQQYVLSNYDVDLTLERSGAYRVTETIRFDFQQGAFSQANRSIPLGRIDSLRDVQVTSVDGAVNTVAHAAEGNDYVIRWTYPERRQPATFTLRYTAYGALEAEDGDNVIDWQAVGDAWGVPVRDVNVEVSFPFGDLARDSIAVRPAAEASFARTGAGWTASFGPAELGSDEGYRVIVRFPERIAVPDDGGDGDSAMMALVGLLLMFLGAGGGTANYLARRGPSADPDAVAQPARPDLSLPEAAALAHHTSSIRQQRMFSAVLFDLAQRGHVTLRREEEDGFFGSTDRVVAEIHADPMDLSDFERALLDELQQHDSLQAFGQGATRFKSEQRKAVRTALLNAGWLQAHTARYRRLIGTGIVFLVVAVGLFFLLSGWAAAIGAGLSAGVGLGALVASGLQYTLTEAGAQRKAEVLAFLRRERTAIESRRDLEPVQAAQDFIEGLPWLMLDTEVNKRWVDDLKDALAATNTPFELPGWMEDAVGLDEDAESASVAAFIPIYAVITSTSAATGGGAVAGVAGAGAAGGAGGGGGGAS